MFHQIEQQKKKKKITSRGEYEILRVPPCKHTQESISCDLKISTGSSIYVVAAIIHEQCASGVQKLLPLYPYLWICAHSMSCVLPLSLETGCIWLLPQCLSLSKLAQIPLLGQCVHISVGSFPYLDADFLSYLRWILFLICISREETVSSFRLFYIWVHCIRVYKQEDTFEVLDFPKQVRFKYKKKSRWADLGPRWCHIPVTWQLFRGLYRMCFMEGRVHITKPSLLMM